MSPAEEMFPARGGRVPAPAGVRARPPWLKKRLRKGKALLVEECVRKYGLHTVCTEAACPNRNECFSRGTATFMILGAVCTRNCRFCNVASGSPAPPDPGEADAVLRGVRELDLSYAVITSVTRDDLPDGGSGAFARVVRLLHGETSCRVEVLTPDFRGAARDIDRVVAARPDVFNHNMETVRRLYSRVRPGACYAVSLSLLRRVADAGLPAKSGVMVGLGETDEELFELFDDILSTGCRMLTIGQYLRPNRECIPVHDYVTPDHFSFLRRRALAMGFRAVNAGPFVRSSHAAHAMYREACR